MKPSIQLKTISKKGVDLALLKAEKYRLLNEPMQSESICKDILEADPGNQRALVTMLLALTDQFGKYTAVDITKPTKLLPLLQNEYERAYYAGIICERRAVASLNDGLGGDADAYEWLVDAMREYEKAEALKPEGNDEAILRWNSCARLIMNRQLQPREVQHVEPPLE